MFSKFVSNSSSCLMVYGLLSVTIFGKPLMAYTDLLSATNIAQQQQAFPEPLAEEEQGITLSLETPYPDSYAFVHDSSFFSLIDGRYVLIDTAAPSHAFKTLAHAGHIGSLAVAPERNEFYIATTYFSRGVTGDRTDIIAVHDMETFSKTDEIIIPPRRASSMPFKAKFRLSGDHTLAFVYNFTPAASITVVDMIKREVLSEIPIPGCTLDFPMGDKGFAAICGDGAILGVNLNEKGDAISENRSVPFIDFDDDAAFLKVARFGDLMFIPTFTGNIHSVDLASPTPKLRETWSLVTDAERAQNWRPGGWQLITGDNSNLFYILMHKNGKEGSHKDGGTDVWVYNAETRKRVQEITLKNHSLSLAIAGDQLIATNADMALDIYDRKSGKFKRNFAGLSTPFVVYTADGK